MHLADKELHWVLTGDRTRSPYFSSRDQQFLVRPTEDHPRQPKTITQKKQSTPHNIAVVSRLQLQPPGQPNLGIHCANQAFIDLCTSLALTQISQLQMCYTGRDRRRFLIRAGGALTHISKFC